MSTLETSATFLFGFFLALLPMLVALHNKGREIAQMHKGYSKVIDTWHEEVKKLEARTFQLEEDLFEITTEWKIERGEADRFRTNYYKIRGNIRELAKTIPTDAYYPNQPTLESRLLELCNEAK